MSLDAIVAFAEAPKLSLQEEFQPSFPERDVGQRDRQVAVVLEEISRLGQKVARAFQVLDDVGARDDFKSPIKLV